MTSDPLQRLDQRIQAAERRIWLRTLVAMGVPIAAAAVVLVIMTERIHQRSSELTTAGVRLEELGVAQNDAKTAVASARRDLAELEKRAQVAEQRANEAQAQVQALESTLREAAQLHRHVRPLDWLVIKQVASRSTGAGALLEALMQARERGIAWSHQNRVDVGFTSPGFAGYVLQKLGRLPSDQPPAKALQSRKIVQESPRIGDVVLYEGGYAMFYFQDPAGSAFVIGMTPFGITALQAEFGPKRLGCIHI